MIAMSLLSTWADTLSLSFSIAQNLELGNPEGLRYLRYYYFFALFIFPDKHFFYSHVIQLAYVMAFTMSNEKKVRGE